MTPNVDSYHRAHDDNDLFRYRHLAIKYISQTHRQVSDSKPGLCRMGPCNDDVIDISSHDN